MKGKNKRLNPASVVAFMEKKLSNKKVFYSEGRHKSNDITVQRISHEGIIYEYKILSQGYTAVFAYEKITKGTYPEDGYIIFKHMNEFDIRNYAGEAHLNSILLDYSLKEEDVLFLTKEKVEPILREYRNKKYKFYKSLKTIFGIELMDGTVKEIS